MLWNTAFAQVFGLMPWDMQRLREREFNALELHIEKMREAAVKRG